MLPQNHSETSFWTMPSPRECPMAPGRQLKPLSPVTPRTAYPVVSPSAFRFQEGLIDVPHGTADGEKISKRYVKSSGLRLVLGSPTVTIPPAIDLVSPTIAPASPACKSEPQSKFAPSFRLAPPPSRQEWKCLKTISQAEREFLKRKVGSGCSLQGTGNEIKTRQRRLAGSPLRSCFEDDDDSPKDRFVDVKLDERHCTKIIRPKPILWKQGMTLSI